MLDPGKKLGPFVIESELGAGAMGTVYKALFTETGQHVAIKIIGLGLAGNEGALARFEREAEILKQLRHPHIVRLLATGRYKRTPFFAMEYVDGESLDRILERRGRLPWEEVVRLGKQLCLALQHAHDKGIIHRDLKPSNLMILRDGTLKLTDFGIAKDTDVTALTGANSTVGTASYMSPEQCRGERHLTNKSDLYSLGVVFYELLTGQKPFVKESPVDMFMAHVTEPVERPSRKTLEIPPWLDTLVCQLMEKKPEHRPFDAAMVKKALDEVEGKMAEQRSAGLDLATARIADRPGAVAADAADREAARALRGKKKKSKAGRPPVPDNTWLVAGLTGTALVGLVALGWWLTRPASPELFYRRAETAIAAGNAESARDTLKAYFAAYPDRTDPNSEQMRTWLETLETDQLERAMNNRFRRKLTPDGDAQQIVYAALRAEDDGDVAEARKSWLQLASTHAQPKNAEEQGWAWLARRKLKAIDDLAGLEKRLIDAREKPDFTPAGEAEKRAWTAVRFETFGDVAAAFDEWEKLGKDFEKDAAARGYVVLAAAKRRAMKDQLPTTAEAAAQNRRAALQARVDELERFLREPTPFHLRKARSLARDVADLYGGVTDPEVQRLVKQVAARAATLPRDKDTR